VKLLGRTTQPEDIDRCMYAVRDRFLYDDEQLKHLRSLWATLLFRDIARSAVVFDEADPRRILAFGIAAPLKQSRFDDIFRDRAAYITNSLLEECMAGKEPFLDEREYAAANASSGLSTFVLQNSISESLNTSSFTNVLSKLSETFVSQYAGCRLRAIAHEAFGVPPEFAIDLGLQVIEHAQPPNHRFPDCPPDRKPSYIAFMTHEQAEQRPGNLTMNTLFLRFAPPLFSFKATERRLLRFAIEGESDERIAALLQIAPRTLKKRWSEIYIATEAVTGVPSGGMGGRRGAEARRHVLRYIRQHPEELHAYRAMNSRPAPATVDYSNLPTSS
jgi:DNA-binding CsgD family transcriptional regulator